MRQLLQDVRCAQLLTLVVHGLQARMHAKSEGKWLLVNIQDEIMFASHMLNRDTWSDDVVQNLVASGFVFWQVRGSRRWEMPQWHH
jgi:hypothetical protein